MSITVAFRVLAFLFICTSFTYCTPRYYSPNAHNVPLFTKKGETAIRIVTGGGDDVNNAVDVQGAVALTNNIGLMINYYNAWGAEEGYGSGSGNLLEGGFGFFNPVNKHLIFETYAGGGGGSVTNYYNSQKIAHSTLKLNRLFIQPSLGYRSQYFDIALSLRAVNVNYTSFKSLFLNNTDYVNEQEQLNKIRDNPKYLLWEPALTVRGGSKTVKAQFQVGFSYNHTNPDFPQETFNANIGLALNLFPIESQE